MGTIENKPDQDYWPGQDYPDREKWLERRATPKRLPHVAFYDPNKPHGSRRDRGQVQGPFNPGVNGLKRAAKSDPDARRRLMELRRKAQRQGPVTIEKQS